MKKGPKVKPIEAELSALVTEVGELRQSLTLVRNERLEILRHYLVMCELSRSINALGRPRWWDLPATRRHRAKLLAQYNREHDLGEELARRQAGWVSTVTTHWKYTGGTTGSGSLKVTNR